MIPQESGISRELTVTDVGAGDLLLEKGDKPREGEAKSDAAGADPRPAAQPPGQPATISCPTCGDSLAASEILWVSRHPELLGDPILGSQEPSRFRPSRFNAAGEAIDAGDLPCHLLACPRCHGIIARPLISGPSVPVDTAARPGSIVHGNTNALSEYLQLVERIRSFLDDAGPQWSGEWSGVAVEYASFCREASERASRCLALLQRGLRSEALHVAECAPSLFAIMPALSVAQFKRWSRTCAVARAPTPPELPDSAAKILEAARDSEQQLGSWLTKHRILALTGAPLPERLGVARALAERDPDNPCWPQCIVELETVLLREIGGRVSRAVEEDDGSALEAIASELSSAAWLAPVAGELRLGVESSLKKHRRTVAFAPMRSTFLQIMAAYNARSYYECASLLSSWNADVDARRIELDPEIWQQLRPVVEWLSDESYSRNASRRLESIQPIVRAHQKLFHRQFATHFALRIGLVIAVLTAVAVAVFLTLSYLSR
jgi:hypothetical protein